MTSNSTNKHYTLTEVWCRLEAAVNDTTDEDYSALELVWKSNLRRVIFQYAAVIVAVFFLNVLVQSSFSNEL